MKTHRGFTLIEIIAVLVLTAILVVTGVQLLSNIMLGYVSAEQTYQNTQKAQVALDRIVVELTSVASMGAITACSQSNITYTDGTNIFMIYQTGSVVLYNMGGVVGTQDYTLMDDVDQNNGLRFTCYDSYTGTSVAASVGDIKLVDVALRFSVGQDLFKDLSTQVAIQSY
ncbi:PulJ/GspJ family protein [Desulfovibrio inopinatus]|uniref:PulJ/GspJ family protein n=1 Tax=Desulfovibrio inopinatus TaxID=102109 RepID=UPI00146F9960|nr:prepilin-type N-terminal cleavage/methylation domain-containing protein [Desulfovibrio inopinatus]